MLDTRDLIGWLFRVALTRDGQAHALEPDPAALAEADPEDLLCGRDLGVGHRRPERVARRALGARVPAGRTYAPLGRA